MPTVAQLKSFLAHIPNDWVINLNTDDNIVAYDPMNDQVILVFPVMENK